MKQVLIYLGNIRTLSPACKAYINKVIKREELNKGQELLKPGEINDKIYFITKGILHCCYSAKRKKVSAWFFAEGKMVVSISSFYDGVPSKDWIVSLEEGEAFYITKEDYDYLIDTFPEFAWIAAKLLPQYMKEIEAHGRLIRDYNKTERYKKVLELYPELVLRVPVGPMASWLDMDPSTLSRIRSQHRRI